MRTYSKLGDFDFIFKKFYILDLIKIWQITTAIYSNYLLHSKIRIYEWLILTMSEKGNR